MPSIESYIGSCSLNAGKVWHVLLDKDIQTNLDSICELVINLFDANSCSIIANYPEHKIKLSQCGEELFFTDTNLQKNSLNEFNLKKQKNNIFRVVSPITLPTNLKFGWLIFDRISEQPLTAKDIVVLNILQKNIVTHIQRRKQNIELDKANELQATVSKFNRDFIFIKDEEFKIVYANDAFLNIYPARMQDQVIGFTTVDAYEKADSVSFLDNDKIAFETGINKVVEKVLTPNGNYITVETTKRRFEDSAGKPYILCVCRDLTEVESLINKLTKANKDLDEFTSIASHDLKSPLNAIKRLLEWISDDCQHLLPQEHAENFQLVINRANRMQTLLEDLLKYARIDQSDMSLTSMSLETVYKDITQLLDIPKTVTVNVNTNNTLINIPAVPFKTVILNLISNAIKHNDKDNGRVDITLHSSYHYYIIEVTDNGPGIEPKYFSLIFELFQTLRSRDKVEGTGIGLSVVKKHIINFGGKIDVYSDGKSGSTFKVFWPKKEHEQITQ